MRFGSNNIELVITCFSCEQKQPVITIAHNQLIRWVRGEHAQQAFNYLTPSERELLISGTCEACFNDMFASDD